jgi:glycosyltransferase involved in cell wall biosynthesis
MVREFEKRGHTCTVCSPTGPDIALGSDKMIKRLGGLGLLYFWWRVSRYFQGKAGEWDAVWLHWPMFMAGSPFRRAVITFHGTYRGFKEMATEMRSSLFLKCYYALMNLAERRYLRALNDSNYLLVAVSPRTATELHSHGISADRVTYISVGVDTEQFRPTSDKPQLRSGLDIPVDALVFLYVGRLTVPKNLFRLVDAFGEIKSQLSHSVLLIAGNGELEKPLSRYIAEKKIYDIRLLGFVPHEELPRIYGCADFFIMASKYEGQPVALLEAMASGLPPIVSKIPVMEQLINESKAGLVVDFSDPVEAARQIEAYVASSKAREDRHRVREYVERTMSSSACAERYLELFTRSSL